MNKLVVIPTLALALVVALLAPSRASASEPPAATREALTPERYREAAASLHTTLSETNDHPAMTPELREAALASMARIQTYVEDDPQANTEHIERELDYLDTLLTPVLVLGTPVNIERPGRICRRARSLGSNIPTTTCFDRRQTLKQEDAARSFLLYKATLFADPDFGRAAGVPDPTGIR